MKLSLVTATLATLALLAAPTAFAAEKTNLEMDRILNALAEKKGKPIESLTPEEARQQPTPADAAQAVMTKAGKKVNEKDLAKTESLEVDGAAGKIPAKLYRPKGKGPFPLIVYYHGGGWVIANKEVYDGGARGLAIGAKALVLSVDYREAPEHKFPAAHDDAFAAYKWAVANAKSLGADPAKIAVAGESAGGNLAVNVSIAARDNGVQLPVYQLAVYPIAGGNLETDSYKANADAKPLNKAMMEWFMKQYLNKPEDAKDPRISLVDANLKGLPPTTIITAQVDPLRSDGKLLADRLTAAGVKTKYENYRGVTHEFFGMAPVLKEAADAQKFATTQLKSAF